MLSRHIRNPDLYKTSFLTSAEVSCSNSVAAGCLVLRALPILSSSTRSVSFRSQIFQNLTSYPSRRTKLPTSPSELLESSTLFFINTFLLVQSSANKFVVPKWLNSSSKTVSSVPPGPGAAPFPARSYPHTARMQATPNSRSTYASSLFSGERS
jgi:hypothetical protein